MSTDRRPVPDSSAKQQSETQKKTSETIEPMTEEERTLLERLLEQAFETINREKNRELLPESGSNLLGTLKRKIPFCVSWNRLDLYWLCLCAWIDDRALCGVFAGNLLSR